MLATIAFGLSLSAHAFAQTIGSQIIGSPGDPPRLKYGAGGFNITPGNGNNGGGVAAEFRTEYNFGDLFWVLSPFFGLSGSSAGMIYGYGGFGIDINITPQVVLTPNAAFGLFSAGSGAELGSTWEFRTGAELAWRFQDYSRLGIAFHHTSNAGISKLNPGAQSLLLVYSFPFP